MDEQLKSTTVMIIDRTNVKITDDKAKDETYSITNPIPAVRYENPEK